MLSQPAVIVAALTAVCAAFLIRQPKPRVRESSESSPLLLPAADWYMRLARRSGRPFGLIRAVVQAPEGGPAPQSAKGMDPSLCQSVKEALRSVDLVVPSNDAEGAMAWIVCPDTDAQGLQVVEKRLRHVMAHGGVSVRFGVTSFPEDGFTLDELLEGATERAIPRPQVKQSSEPAGILQSYGQMPES